MGAPSAILGGESWAVGEWEAAPNHAGSTLHIEREDIRRRLRSVTHRHQHWGPPRRTRCQLTKSGVPRRCHRDPRLRPKMSGATSLLRWHHEAAKEAAGPDVTAGNINRCGFHRRRLPAPEATPLNGFRRQTNAQRTICWRLGYYPTLNGLKVLECNMYGDNPILPAAAQSLLRSVDAARIRNLLHELDEREALATAALPTKSDSLGWANLGPDSGLTESQEDFVDYWTPQRIIDECLAKRELISALQQWARTTGRADDQRFIDHLLAV